MSEWIKLRSLRSFVWGVALSVAAALFFTVNAARWDYSMWWTYTAEQRANFDPTGDAFSQNIYLTLIIAFGSLGAVAVVNEYSSGLIRVSYAAVPDRRALMLAKVCVVTFVLLVVGVVVALASFGISQAILSGRHAAFSLVHPGVPREAIASALLPPICGLAGMAIGTVVRHTASSVVGTIVVLLLIPNYLRDDHRWEADIDHTMPMRAWQRLTTLEPHLTAGNGWWPATITGSWVVFAVWPVVSILIMLIATDRRDV